VALQNIVSEMNALLGIDTREFADVEFKIAPDLPKILGDPAQLRQVVMNLVTNAIDALGGQPGDIKVLAQLVEVAMHFLKDGWIERGLPEGSCVMLEVADTGCGMDENTKSRMFDPFFSTKATGHGLGLAAVRGIVSGHGGSLRVYSTPGGGTTLSVLLPISHKDQEPSSESRNSEPLSTPKRHQPGTILVVDDQELIRVFLETALQTQGYEVLLASNGLEALEIFAERGKELDLILLDITMPQMDGIEVLERIRASNTTLPVVLSSGYLEQRAAPNLDQLEYSGFLQKPYRLEDLEAMLAGIHSPGPAE